MFGNNSVSLDALPTVDSLCWERLAGRHLWELIARHALFLAIALALGVAASSLGIRDIPAGVLLAASGYAVLHLLIATLWARAALQRKGYAIREHDILFQSGVLWRKLIAVPFNRIQHVETTSGVLERAFGLATIVVYTAGGSGGDLNISGLEAERAGRLRDYILGRAGQADESG